MPCRSRRSTISVMTRAYVKLNTPGAGLNAAHIKPRRTAVTPISCMSRASRSLAYIASQYHGSGWRSSGTRLKPWKIRTRPCAS